MRISPKEWQTFAGNNKRNRTNRLPLPLSLSATPTLCLSLPSHTMAGLLISVAQKMAAASANFADNENRVVSLVPFPVPFFPLLVICKVVQKLSSKVTIFSCRGLCLLPAGGWKAARGERNTRDSSGGAGEGGLEECWLCQWHLII